MIRRFTLAALLLFFPLFASAQEQWYIPNFTSDIVIQESGEVRVTETIAVDFATIAKHGIYRDIPYVYRDQSGEDTYTEIDDITVLQDGSPAITEITKNNSNIRIRIGNPNVTITGEHQYQIAYTARGVLRSFGQYDELYWNMTGNDWEVPIASAEAVVHVPARIEQVACYEGGVGSTTSCANTHMEGDRTVFTAQNLGAGEGLTIAVGYAPGVIPILTVAKPLSMTDVLFSPTTYGIAGISILLGIGVLARHWYRYGRDRYWLRSHLPGVRSDRDDDAVAESILPLFSRQVVVAEYESPDGLRPGEIGVLLDEKADTLDVSGTIVDLASRGYMEITEVPKTWMFGKVDYEFTRTEKNVEELREYEHELLKRIFEDGNKVTMASLKNSFYKDLQVVKKKLYESVVDRKLFASNPTTIRGAYVGFGILLTMIGVALFFGAVALVEQSTTVKLYHYIAVSLAVSFVVLGIALALVSRAMPRKTGYGREVYRRALGYEVFVSTTEKYRAKFLENEGLFFEVLPYAIVFGVTDKLAKAFKEMGIEPPSPTWYHGSSAFNVATFATNIDTFSGSLSSAMASTPGGSGSSGGGSSGGGFGGGGGGSW